MNFNKELFIEDVKKTHLNKEEITRFDKGNNIREELDSIIDYDKVLFSKALDDICNNSIGNTMFRLLLVKVKKDKDKYC
jgi:hypothetical protein